MFSFSMVISSQLSKLWLQILYRMGGDAHRCYCAAFLQKQISLLILLKQRNGTANLILSVVVSPKRKPQ